MKFSKGDKIALKGQNKEGRIVRYLSDTLVEVILTDTSLVEVEEDQLEYPYLNWFRKESRKKSDEQTIKYRKPNEDFEQEKKPKGLLLGIHPEYFSTDFDDLVDTLKIYFYNDTADELDFLYTYTDKSTELIEVKKRLKPYENFYLHSIPFSHLNDRPKLSLKLAPTGEPLSHIKIPFSPKSIYSAIEALHKKELPAHFIQLGSDIYSIYIPDSTDTEFSVSEGLASISKSKKAKASENKNSSPLSPTLDLHIEALEPIDYKSISSSDILLHQLQAFRTFMAEAIQNQESKITIIHGIGKGKLKEEIHNLLAQNSFVKKYQNELHPLYGYGATEIWLK